MPEVSDFCGAQAAPPPGTSSVSPPGSFLLSTFFTLASLVKMEGEMEKHWRGELPVCHCVPTAGESMCQRTSSWALSTADVPLPAEAVQQSQWFAQWWQHGAIWTHGAQGFAGKVHFEVFGGRKKTMLRTRGRTSVFEALPSRKKGAAI